MPVIKASLIFFLHRIFGHVRVFRVALWVVVGYVSLWWLTTFWMSVFQCWPISSNWGTTPEQMGNCLPGYLVREEIVLVKLRAWLTLQDLVLLGSVAERFERRGPCNRTNTTRLASSNAIEAKTGLYFDSHYCHIVRP